MESPRRLIENLPRGKSLLYLLSGLLCNIYAFWNFIVFASEDNRHGIHIVIGLAALVIGTFLTVQGSRKEADSDG